MSLLGHLRICLHYEPIWREFLLAHYQDGETARRKLRMSQDKVRAAHGEAQWRMKSLNQRQGLPVTGHRDRPMRLNVD